MMNEFDKVAADAEKALMVEELRETALLHDWVDFIAGVQACLACGAMKMANGDVLMYGKPYERSCAHADRVAIYEKYGYALP